MKKAVVTIYCLVLILAMALALTAYARENSTPDRTFSDEIITSSF